MVASMGDVPFIDFVGGKVGYRLRSREGRDQALLRAIGLKKGALLPTVVDATAGLGRDAFLMASHGVMVTMIERAPIMHAALGDAMARAQAAGDIYADIISRMTLLHGDSITLLPTLSPDAVLVDPMHPPRGKSALVKKEMRILREVVGEDVDQIALMQAALGSGAKRVVLKWPQNAPPMPGIRAPSHSIDGKTTRYDVFMMV